MGLALIFFGAALDSCSISTKQSTENNLDLLLLGTAVDDTVLVSLVAVELPWFERRIDQQSLNLQ